MESNWSMNEEVNEEDLNDIKNFFLKKSSFYFPRGTIVRNNALFPVRHIKSIQWVAIEDDE